MGSNNSTPQVQPRARTPPTYLPVIAVPSPPTCPTGPAPVVYELSTADLYHPLRASGQPDEPFSDQPTTTTTARNMAKEVARCSVLLRQMFALDLEIWGMGGCVEEEEPRREELKRKADALFAEVRWMVYGLRSMADMAGSVEEKRQIREVCRVIDRHESPRYV